MKKYYFLLLYIFLPLVSSAQGYQPLAQGLPFATPNSSPAGTQIGPYLEGMYEIGISIAAALAVIMIIIGGIQYMSSDAIGGKEDGKNRITSALWGLLLALASYLILYTINPDLLSTNLFVSKAVDQNVLNPTDAHIAPLILPNGGITNTPSLNGNVTTANLSTPGNGPGVSISSPNGTTIDPTGGSVSGEPSINAFSGPTIVEPPLPVLDPLPPVNGTISGASDASMLFGSH